MTSVTEQHPDMADELRELWAVAQLADHFAGPAKEKAGAPATIAPNAGVQSSPIPRVFGDYELLEELGQGGMGLVYKARQRHPERIVAVKMMKQALASAAEIARFRAEPQSTARLEGHPNIVAVHEVGGLEVGHEDRV